MKKKSLRRSEPLLAHLPAPLRWALGMGLLGLTVWLPALVALFR